MIVKITSIELISDAEIAVKLTNKKNGKIVFTGFLYVDFGRRDEFIVGQDIWIEIKMRGKECP